MNQVKEELFQVKETLAKMQEEKEKATALGQMKVCSEILWHELSRGNEDDAIALVRKYRRQYPDAWEESLMHKDVGGLTVAHLACRPCLSAFCKEIKVLRRTPGECSATRLRFHIVSHQVTRRCIPSPIMPIVSCQIVRSVRCRPCSFSIWTWIQSEQKNQRAALACTWRAIEETFFSLRLSCVTSRRRSHWIKSSQRGH